jgi:excisionase family DNA binding protein
MHTEKNTPITFITVAEAVALLGGTIGRDTLYRAFARGEAPGRRIGRRVLLDRGWVEASRTGPTGRAA